MHKRALKKQIKHQYVTGKMSVAELHRTMEHIPGVPTYSTMRRWAVSGEWDDMREYYGNHCTYPGDLNDGDPLPYEEIAETAKAELKTEVATEVEVVPESAPDPKTNSATEPKPKPDKKEKVSPYQPIISPILLLHSSGSKDAIDPHHYADKIAKPLRPFYLSSVADDDQLSLSRDIGIVDAELADVMNQVNAGGSSDDWAIAKRQFKKLEASIIDVQAGDTSGNKRFKEALDGLKQVFSKEDRTVALKQLAFWQKQKRNMIETEIKRIEKADGYLSVGEAMSMAGEKIGAVLQVVKDEGNTDLALKIVKALELVSA